MHISYASEELRDYCLSLVDKSTKSPLKYILYENNSKIILTVTYENIKINCIVITSYNSPNSKQIARLKIIEILNSDLQITNINDLTA